MKSMRIIAAALACAGALTAEAHAAAQAPDVQVSAVPEYAAVRPGSVFRVAVRLQLPAGWHIGWTNPGAGGLATTIAWRVPDGVSAGTTVWPYPETDDAGGEVTHVYRGTVVLFSSFAAGPGVAGTVKLSGDLNWGICRVVCVQQHRTVQLSLAVVHSVAAHSTGWAEAAAAMRLIPMRERGARFGAISHGDSVRLAITGLKAGPAPGSWVTYFPLEPGRRSVVAPVRRLAGGIAVTLPRGVVSGTPPGGLSGVLVAAHAPGTQAPVRALAVHVPVTR